MCLVGLRKAYPGVVALADLTMTVAAGEVVGLVGENGAGKSTLMKILGGVVAPDAGSIVIDGRPHSALSVAGSMKAGIAFVHQELNLFENLDVAANIFIGREPRKAGPFRFVDERSLHERADRLLSRIGANFSSAALVGDLSLAQRQMVEIAKALSLDARVLILDEPTSSLPIAETDKLLDVVAGLRRRGVSVIFISHRLHEVERVADRVVVLRDGKLAGVLAKREIAHGQMVKLMIGRDLKARVAGATAEPGAVALTARGVRTAAYPAQRVDLDFRRGEILGLAGLVGSGRTELARALFGIDPLLGGALTLDGEPFHPKSAAQAVARGVFLAPEDRKRSGVLTDFSITQNITLPNLGAHSTAFLVSASRERDTAEGQSRRLAVKAPNVDALVSSLSGGNQQKVVLGKWLAMAPKVMIFDEPTRGIDIGAKDEIYRLMRALADSGVAVLMISSDMEESIGVSDRIAVMHEGRIAGVLPRDRFSEENILLLAVGQSPREEERP